MSQGCASIRWRDLTGVSRDRGRFDPSPSLRTFDLLVHAHLLTGGLAIAAMGARDRWPAAASVLAAVVFMLGGAAAGRLQHTGIILGYGLFPGALLLLQMAAEL